MINHTYLKVSMLVSAVATALVMKFCCMDKERNDVSPRFGEEE